MRLRRALGPAQRARVRIADRGLAVDHKLVAVGARLEPLLDPPQPALVDRQRVGLHIPIIKIADYINATLPRRPERERHNAVASIVRAVRSAFRRGGNTRCLLCYHKYPPRTLNLCYKRNKRCEARSVPGNLNEGRRNGGGGGRWKNGNNRNRA